MEFKIKNWRILTMELLFVVFQGLISNVNMQKIQDPGTCCKLCILNYNYLITERSFDFTLCSLKTI